MRFSLYLMKRFLRIPGSCKSPKEIMSSTPLMDVWCIDLTFESAGTTLVYGWDFNLQFLTKKKRICTFPSSSLMVSLDLSPDITFAPMGTSNSPGC
jgi:hypothetical protein